MSEEGSRDQRRATRYRRLLLARYQAGAVQGMGHLSVISATGLFLRCDLLPRVGESVAIYSGLGESKLLASGLVRSVCEREGDRGFGLEIERTTGAYIDMIREQSHRSRMRSQVGLRRSSSLRGLHLKTRKSQG